MRRPRMTPRRWMIAGVIAAVAWAGASWLAARAARKALDAIAAVAPYVRVQHAPGRVTIKFRLPPLDIAPEELPTMLPKYGSKYRRVEEVVVLDPASPTPAPPPLLVEAPVSARPDGHDPRPERTRR